MKQILLLALLFTTSTLFGQWNGIVGQGPVVKKELSVKNFDGGRIEL